VEGTPALPLHPSHYILDKGLNTVLSLVRRRCNIAIELFEFADDVAVLNELESRLPVFSVYLTQTPVLFRRHAAEQRITFQDLRHTQHRPPVLRSVPHIFLSIFPASFLQELQE